MLSIILIFLNIRKNKIKRKLPQQQLPTPTTPMT